MCTSHMGWLGEMGRLNAAFVCCGATTTLLVISKPFITNIVLKLGASVASQTRFTGLTPSEVIVVENFDTPARLVVVVDNECETCKPDVVADPAASFTVTLK